MNYVPGLEGVVVGETSISHVEGEAGRLSYRGQLIEDIVNMDYLSVAWLVLFGELPDAQERARLVDYLQAHQSLKPFERELIRQTPVDMHPMRILQGMVPLIALEDDPFEEHDLCVGHGLQILARYPALIAEIRHHRDGGGSPEADLSPEDYLGRHLALFTGSSPDSRALEIFRTVQLLQIDHSFNAGTFASRVIGSTRADVQAVVSGALGALSGVLHGGADQAALLDARSLASPEDAGAFVDAVLSRGGRIMGMGHREYRTVDPRSVILKPLADELCRGSAFEADYLKLLAIETAFNARMAARGKEVWANLEFYKGVVYEALGIPPAFFTATFALSRSVGWLAHFIEARVNNRIIRPAAIYIGRMPGS